MYSIAPHFWNKAEDGLSPVIEHEVSEVSVEFLTRRKSLLSTEEVFSAHFIDLLLLILQSIKNNEVGLVCRCCPCFVYELALC